MTIVAAVTVTVIDLARAAVGMIVALSEQRKEPFDPRGYRSPVFSFLRLNGCSKQFYRKAPAAVLA